MAGTIIAGSMPTIYVDTPSSTDNSTKLINVQGVVNRTRSVATVDSPRFAGTTTAPTPPKGNNSKRIATTKFVQDQISEVVQSPSRPTVRDFPTTAEAGLSYQFRICCSRDMFNFPVDYYQIQHMSPLTFNKDTNILENEIVTMTIPVNSDNVTYPITVVGIRGTKVSEPLVLTVQVISIPTVIGQPFGGGFYMGRFALNGRRYALIVSPRDSGTFEFSSYGSGNHLNGYLNNMLTGQLSNIDGKTNTELMKMMLRGQKLLDWVNTVNTTGIDDKHDWYIPSMDELEMIYRNAKPTTEQNIITSSSGIVNNNNMFRDFEFPRGQNLNSIPNSAPYTLTNPTQTHLVNFTGDSGQALYGAFYSSTARSTGTTNGIMNDMWFGVQMFGTLNTQPTHSFSGPIGSSNQLFTEHWLGDTYYGWATSQPYKAKVRLVRRIPLDV